jgi:hypothetical protein
VVQKPIEGSNPSLSAKRRVNSARPVFVVRDGSEAGIRTRDMEKGVRQNRRRRFWTTRTRRPQGEGRRPESIPPSPPNMLAPECNSRSLAHLAALRNRASLKVRSGSVPRLGRQPAMEWSSAFDVVIFAPLTSPRALLWLGDALFGAVAIRHVTCLFAPVAQLDRAPGYEPGGREFESLRAHHNSFARLALLLPTELAGEAVVV